MRSLKTIHSLKRRKLRLAELPEVYRVLRTAFGHQRWWPGETPFEVMIGAILTQNTAWTNVEKAIANLRKNGQLSFRALCRLPASRIAKMIRPAGYFNVKARRLKCFVEFLARECGGDLSLLRSQPMPVLREKLLGVNGIGPETADSILLYALEKKSFVIDAYTRRIFSRHGLMAEDEPYEAWRAALMRALPSSRGLYNDYHAQIVQTAKTFCRKKPRCGECPLCAFF